MVISRPCFTFIKLYCLFFFFTAFQCFGGKHLEMFSFFGFSSAHFSYKQTSFKVYLLLFTTQSRCRALSVYSNCNQTFPSAWLTVWTNRTRKTFSYMSICQNTIPPIIYYIHFISKSRWIACHWQCWYWSLYLWSWRHFTLHFVMVSFSVLLF